MKLFSGEVNDYTFIETATQKPVEIPGPGFSVIVPVYNRIEALRRTLAGLCHQRFRPFEVIVADDGSSQNIAEAIKPYRKFYPIKYTSQPDRGYRLSRIRNKAASHAAFPWLVFLDCDVIPLPDMLEQYASLFLRTDKAVLLGLRRFVDASSFSAEVIQSSADVLFEIPDIASRNPMFERHTLNGITRDWRLEIYRQSRQLKDSIFPFRCAVGANMAMPSATFHHCGGFCEEFNDWGGEDAELGYRLYNQGMYFIPVNTAVGLHQEDQASQVDRRLGLRKTSTILKRKCPMPFFRPSANGIRYEVPKISIIVGHQCEAESARIYRQLRSQPWLDFELLPASHDTVDTEPLVMNASRLEAVLKSARGMYMLWIFDPYLLTGTSLESVVNVLDTTNTAGIEYTMRDMLSAVIVRKCILSRVFRLHRRFGNDRLYLGAAIEKMHGLSFARMDSGG